MYLCPKCNEYKGAIIHVKAGQFTDLNYLRCTNCLHTWEARNFELKTKPG